MPHTVDQRIGNNVRAELARNGILQAALATELGLTQPGVSRRLSGNTPFTVAELQRIAQLTSVPLDVLVPPLDDEHAALAGGRASA